MTNDALTERLTREWFAALDETAIPKADAYVVELDADSDPCCPRLTLNGKLVAVTTGVEIVPAGQMLLNFAGVLPGLTDQHAKRIRRVRVEVA